MCGIAGIVAPECSRHRLALEGMCRSLAHRGPDAQGVHFYPNCGLAHTRLAIIDLATGDQPLFYDQGRLGVVFNGELYGYKEIRAGLDLPFHTTSDTELIPALYRLHGTDMCRHLPGMFAFALWDEPRQRLFCARDRFGEKPFYYALLPNGELVFASELKAILRSGLVRPVLSRKAVGEYLTLRYVPEGMTIYSTIETLPPGCALVWENGTVRVFPYWDLPLPLDPAPSYNEAKEEFARLLTQAVRRCLVADVEVGGLLSGGLDSTTIVALFSGDAKLRTFAFGFTGKRDERPYAREAAAFHDLPYTELTDEIIDFPYLLRRMIEVYDEPFADSSAIPTWMLCRLVSQHVKVAVTGDGGDELLAGYDYWYRRLARNRYVGRWTSPGWSRCADNHWQDITYFPEHELSAMGMPLPTRPVLAAPSDSLDDALRMDLRGFLVGDVLRKIDRAAMSHGLELRAPFLDRDLASFLIALPWRYKSDGETDKRLLRSAFEHLWPPLIRTRGKQGFGTDVSLWLTRPDTIPLRRYYLLEKQRRIRELIPGPVLDAYAQDTGIKAWLLFILAMWLEHTPWEAG